MSSTLPPDPKHLAKTLRCAFSFNVRRAPFVFYLFIYLFISVVYVNNIIHVMQLPTEDSPRKYMLLVSIGVLYTVHIINTIE